jgi:hypothetical protein
MAALYLHRRDTDRDYLPEVCMACGQPSCAHIRKNFSWCPPWVGITILAGLLPYLIIALILTKRMTVDVPVCERHRGYWWKRYLLMFLPFFLIAGVGIAVGVAFSTPGRDDPSGLICFATFAVGVVWLIVAAIMQTRMIRPTEITDRTIRLKNVHADFVAQFDALRRSRRDDDWDEDGEEYEERLRRRQQRRAEERTGASDGPSDAFRARPEDITDRSPPARDRDTRDTYRADPREERPRREDD